MHVAVAGGAGDLGSAITHAFHSRGVPTSALVHPRTTAFRLADLPENVIRRVDLVDTESLTEELRRYDDVVVVNAVGRSGHPDTPGGPDRVSLWRDTVLTTVSILDALPPRPVALRRPRPSRRRHVQRLAARLGRPGRCS